MGIIRAEPPPCPSCRNLGDLEHDGTTYRLYICLLRLHSLPVVDPNWPTLMATFDAGFRSGLNTSNDPILREAKRRAVAAGLYDPNAPLHPGMTRVVDALADLVDADLRQHPSLPDGSEFRGGAVIAEVRAPRRRRTRGVR